jgi:dihydrofolate synthase/folylpolyglutamate synthase
VGGEDDQILREALKNEHNLSRFMGYADLVDWMFNLERFGIKLGLDNISEFLSRLGHPERDFRSVHVTGTNGKGSVCAFTSEIFRNHGLKVGLYTSPHLVDFRERIRINGRQIAEKDVVRLGDELRSTMDEMASEDKEKQLTFFEFTTGLAFKHFSEKKVDLVVAEVGMGGRLDATNVLVPEVSAITRIGLEHTNYLGSTIQEIAREKAGIVKQGVSVVTIERNPEALGVIEGTCEKKGSRLRRIGMGFEAANVRQSLNGTRFDYSGERKLAGMHTRLVGAYQAENAACAIAIAEELARKGLMISDEEIRKGISSARWPGRLDVVSKRPLVIFDGSHNPDGIRTTVRILRELGVTPLTYVLGCMDDKDALSITKSLSETAAKMVVTQARYKRALPADQLASIARQTFTGPMEVFSRAEDAFSSSMEYHPGAGLCVIGSLYLVGEAIEWWNSIKTRGRHRVTQPINQP